ncbi:glycosyltransferase family 2 protein [Derxia gummosa]|uniref:Glycosyltransferase family 2 protein n=1 Tax=Derxia gummosa DSM 723 TaxID=1121388 RepID=A0A8B6X273_9BURK|nr:glycosyltransferase [Derxia gummosa]
MEAVSNSASLSGVGIGFCTYKRKAGMVRLLDHLAIAAKALPAPPVIIVVDNDGNDPSVGEAAAVFAARSGITVRYLIERQPGISAARNAVFGEADRLGVRYLAMIDDDEWPSPEWLAELIRVSVDQKAVVVGGPVRPVFPDSAAHLRKWARYWSVDKQLLLGKPFVFCTCNFLLDMQRLTAEPRPFFDEAFGLSGGGDTVFFRKLFFRGHPMAWADGALVYEEVPQSRASLKWMRQRRFRVGNHAVRWETLDGGKVRSFAKTLGLTARLLCYPLYNREPDSRLLGWLLELDKVRGRFASHFGDVFVEYARPQQPGEKACR